MLTYEEWLKQEEGRLLQEYKQSQNKKFLIAVILDRSGSMNGKENDVIGGVNTFLKEQKEHSNPAKIMFVRFDSEIETFRALSDIKECSELASNDYQPRGVTALLDAIGSTIQDLDRYIEIERPARTIVVVVTDGYENASTRFNKSQIKEMILHREKQGWGFIYLGANVDAFTEAGSLGMRACNISGYQNTSIGIKTAYCYMSSNISDMRSCCCSTANSLGKNIGEYK